MLPSLGALSELPIDAPVDSDPLAPELESRLKSIEDRLAALEGGGAGQNRTGGLVELRLDPNLRAPDFVTLRNSLAKHTGLAAKNFVKPSAGTRAKVSIYVAQTGGRGSEVYYLNDFQTYVDSEMSENAFCIVALLKSGRSSEVRSISKEQLEENTDRDVDMAVAFDTEAADPLRHLHAPDASKTNAVSFQKLANAFEEHGVA